VTDSELTYDIIGSAMEVHREIGPGHREAPYENALKIELRSRGHRAEQQQSWPILYKSSVVGECFTDLIVDQRVVVEVKAEDKITEAHVAQLLNYLRLTGIPLGLVINFKPYSLEHRRVVLNHDE
jgi:GxxExxY protein